MSDIVFVEVIIGIVVAALGGTVGYVVRFVNKLHQDIITLQKEVELNKINATKHVNSCVNFEKRKNWID